MDGRFPGATDVEDSRVQEILDQCSDECFTRLITNAHPVGLSITPTRDFPNPLLYSNDSAESQQLDSDLLARFHRLKAPPPTPLAPLATSSSSSSTMVTVETSSTTSTTTTVGNASQIPPPPTQDVDILGSDLASRLAALKAPKNPKDVNMPLDQLSVNPRDVIKPLNQPSDDFQGSNPKSDETDVDKLLKSFTEQVRLKKKLGDAKLSSSIAEEDIESGVASDEDHISESEVELMVEWAKDAARLGENDEEDDTDEEQADIPSDGDSAVVDSSKTDGAKKMKGGMAK